MCSSEQSSCDVDRCVYSASGHFMFIYACIFKKMLFTFTVSPFPSKAVGFNFPPIFGMTLTGPVGIEAPASHHAAGG